MFLSYGHVSFSPSLLKKTHTKKATIGTSQNTITGQLMLVPRFVLLVVGAGLDVSCEFYLHVPKQWDHLQLLYSKRKKYGHRGCLLTKCIIR